LRVGGNQPLLAFFIKNLKSPFAQPRGEGKKEEK